ncbi:MAG: hypothetical protein Q9M34_09555, partial [Sulfurimonas sp.]|nr:hypothetical protein [Sulfurimonas sp.]
MGFRKLKAKKYNSIYEYFKDSDKDKKTTSYYIQYRDINNNPRKVKCDALTKEDALKILNDKKAEIAKDRVAIQKDSSLFHQKIMNGNLTLEDVAKLYFPTKTAKTVNMISAGFYYHINPSLGKIKISKIKTDDIKQLSEELKKKPAKRGAQSKAKSDAAPLNPRTVKKQIAALRALFNWAIKEG